MSAERFFADERLAAEGRITLAADEARHLRSVLRKKVGDEVILFDGRGQEAPARVLVVEKGRVELLCGTPVDATRAPAIDIGLAIALPRRGTADDVLRRAVEAGASRITPLRTLRAVHRPDRKDDDRRGERFAKLAISSMKQCGRNLMPVLEAPVDLADLVLAPDELGILGATRPAESMRHLERRLGGFPARIRVVIGPEGGLAPEEEEALAARGFAAVSLGPQVLRVETAVCAFLGLLASVTPDELGPGSEWKLSSPATDR